MEGDEGINVVPSDRSQSYPMNAGDGPHSYANNSISQRRVIEASKELIYEVIEEKLEIDASCVDGSKAFGIADLGCSVGQNTFMAVQNIIEAVERVYKANNQSNSSSSLEFHVFFNDHYNNDFNSLFRSSSYASKSYYAAGVAGSFYGRLFPKSSLHYVNCSYSLQWMSQVPKEVVDKKSPAWNGNRIHYTTSSVKQVHEAYAAQYKKDIECFLSARSQEIVEGGLMLIVVPTLPIHCIASQTAHAAVVRHIEACLSEMVKLGHTSEEKVDAFNMPIYYPTSNELEAIIKENEKFEIERMGILNTMTNIKLSVELYVGIIRSAMEALFKQHFGDEVIQELFQRFSDKVAHNLYMLDPNPPTYEVSFVIVKCK